MGIPSPGFPWSSVLRSKSVNMMSRISGGKQQLRIGQGALPADRGAVSGGGTNGVYVSTHGEGSPAPVW